MTRAAPTTNTAPMSVGCRAALPVVLAAAAFYGAFTFVALALHGWNPLWFVWIGERFAYGDPHGHLGYDGQFVYYLARDGWAALPHLDNQPYRMQRIFYPLLARGLSGGDAAAIPWIMLAINATAILTTTWLVTGWLIAHRQWRWWGLVYPLFVGTFMAYSRDLTEPLACALAFAGVLAWFGERQVLAIVLLALAALTRETMVLFAVGLGLAELARGHWARLAALALAVAPMLAWQLYLGDVLDVMPITRSAPFSYVPAAGLFARLSLEPGRLSALLFVGLPGLVLAPLAVAGVVREPRDPIRWLIAVHWAFLLVFPAAVYEHVMAAGRNAAALLLALLLAFPQLSPALRMSIAGWSILPTVIWLGPVLWWAPWTAKV